MSWRAMLAPLAALLVAVPATMDRAIAESVKNETSWQELGCQKVIPGGDHDTILLAPGRGAFQAIRLRVEQSDAIVRHVQVVFEDGAAEKFEIGHRIHADEESKVLDFADGPRAIKRINLAYSSTAGQSDPARVCADGLSR
jgi:hypothetical protein